MSLIDHPAFLRTVLRIDAATCVATGLVMTAGCALVSGLTQIPPAVLLVAGGSLFPIAVFMAFVATRQPIWGQGVWLVILGNVGWVLASVWLIAGGAIAQNGFGTAFVTMQAAVVAALALLECVGVARVTQTV